MINLEFGFLSLFPPYFGQVMTNQPGGSLRYRGGPHLRYVFRGRRGLFLRPPHVRDFVKEVWGSKSPYNLRNIRGSDAVTPEVSAKQAEDYKILN